MMNRLLALLIGVCMVNAGEAAGPLPTGSAPKPIELSYFPSRLHAFVWRNWECANLDRMAKVVGATPEQIARIGETMGLPPHVTVTEDQLGRGYIAVIRRNWHLLPYDQLLTLLGWDADKLAYALREDDFLWIKLGQLKPASEPIKYTTPDEGILKRCDEIKAIVDKYCAAEMTKPAEPRFAFVRQLSEPLAADIGGHPGSGTKANADTDEPIRFLYSYFAVYGDPLLDDTLNPYPDGLLQRIRQVGANGVWLHVVLRQLAPSKVFPEFGEGCVKRLGNLRKLVERANKYGVKVYLYMNEPRAMPSAFFTDRDAAMQGVREGDFTAMCTSHPAVRQWITDALRHVFTEVPGLGGVFTITGSENLTNCWSHYNGSQCPRCSTRKPEEVVAEINRTIADGVHAGNPAARVLVWDWGWKNEWCEGIINALPKDVYHMSVSEWDLPIARGGVPTTVGEYSLSAVGPGPRAKRNWEFATKAGLKTVAKIQANCTWELSALPYLPVMNLVAQHCEGLRQCGVTNQMLSWTLGGYPSVNLELVDMLSSNSAPTSHDALRTLAIKRYGSAAADRALEAWSTFSKAFTEFPYHGSFLYDGPMQWGPANPLYAKPSGYHASMVGFPYDDIRRWRAVYPSEVLAGQLEKVATGWKPGLDSFALAAGLADTPEHKLNAEEDVRLARAAWLHIASAANQTRFIIARDECAAATQPATRELKLEIMKLITNDEIDLARQMFELTRRDSRIGYEASNHYNYYPFDLVEKIINCDWILRNELK